MKIMSNGRNIFDKIIFLKFISKPRDKESERVKKREINNLTGRNKKTQSTIYRVAVLQKNVTISK